MSADTAAVESKPERPGAAYATDQNVLLFAELLVLFFITALIDESQLLRAAQSLLVAVVILTAFRVAGVEPSRYRVVVGIVAAATVAFILTSLSDRTTGNGIVKLGLGTLLAIGSAVTVVRIFEHKVIHFGQVIAALAAYLQTALAFGFTFSALGDFTTEPFFNEIPTAPISDTLYFSVVTISTLGYGDLTPATDLGRSLVMLETILGQIFIIVLVARLVGSLGLQRLVDQRPERHRERPGRRKGRGSGPRGETGSPESPA